MKDDKNSLDKASTMLEESESRYKFLVHSVKDYAIFMLDTNGIIKTWNQGAERFKGYKDYEIIGKHFSVFYTEEDIKRAYPDYELKVAKEVGQYEDEGWRIRKDGSQFWANVLITAVYDSDNNLIGFAKVTKDLTERKKLQDEVSQTSENLRKSEGILKLLIEGVKDYGIFMLSPDGKVATWNVGAERINGYTADEIIGKHFSTFYPQEAVKAGFPDFELRKALEDGRFEDEGWRMRKDGTSFWANVAIAPIYNNKNEHIGFSKVTRDLSEHLRNEKLRKKNQELLKINTDLDNFIYTASHDLKSPISNLEGLLRILNKSISSKIDQSDKAIIKMMETSLEKLNKTIADLTEVVKVQKDEDKVLEKINLRELIKDLKVDLFILIQNSNAEIEEQLDAPEIEFARRNLRSIVYNLIINAIKYRAADRQLKIKITSSQTSEYYIIAVKDNGLGLSKEQRDKLFTLFKRFHKHVEGTGIGLYIVKRIIENNGGKIEVQSEVNQGTEFKIFLKKKEVAE